MASRPPSKALKKLREALAPPPNRMTQTKLAELCGVSPQAVSNWVNGVARPSPEAMLVIEKHLGIAMREWVDSTRRTGTDD